MTKWQTGRPVNRSLSPDNSKICSFLQNVQLSSGADPVRCSVGTGTFSGTQLLGCQVEHSYSSTSAYGISGTVPPLSICRRGMAPFFMHKSMEPYPYEKKDCSFLWVRETTVFIRYFWLFASQCRIVFTQFPSYSSLSLSWYGWQISIILLVKVWLFGK